MADRVLPGPVGEGAAIREAVCVHTKKIYDSCRDKDCAEDLRVYPLARYQPLIDGAQGVRPRAAELIWTSVDVEEVSFNRGWFSVDIRFYYKVTGEALSLLNVPQEFTGLAIYDKRVILFGSEGSAKIFTSDMVPGGMDLQRPERTNLPTAVVEAVDPVPLSMKLADAQSSVIPEAFVGDIPRSIAAAFPEDLEFENGQRRVYVCLGQFSIVRLERDSQLLMPSYDYCMPEKECSGGDYGDPCSMFARVNFPIDEFFPPDTVECPEGYREARAAFTR